LKKKRNFPSTEAGRDVVWRLIKFPSIPNASVATTVSVVVYSR
jgi:hypothetical protein